MQDFLDLLADNNIYLIRLVLALILGGAVGMERQAHGRAAGLRTNILVCLGSALVIVAFQRIMDHQLPDATSAIRMDPARAAAGVITGIGFLGAGTIVKSKEFVRGLTTAASVWVVAAIGVAVGLGEILLAVTVTLLVLVALVVLHRIPIASDIYGRITVKGRGGADVARQLTDILTDRGFTIKRTVFSRSGDGEFEAAFIVRHRHRNPVGALGEACLETEGVERYTVS